VPSLGCTIKAAPDIKAIPQKPMKTRNIAGPAKDRIIGPREGDSFAIDRKKRHVSRASRFTRKLVPMRAYRTVRKISKQHEKHDQSAQCLLDGWT
jgi:hypothetical protein